MVKVLVKISGMDDFNKFSRYFSYVLGIKGHISVHDFS